jgi:hypothetical protein
VSAGAREEACAPCEARRSRNCWRRCSAGQGAPAGGATRPPSRCAARATPRSRGATADCDAAEWAHRRRRACPPRAALTMGCAWPADSDPGPAAPAASRAVPHRSPLTSARHGPRAEAQRGEGAAGRRARAGTAPSAGPGTASGTAAAPEPPPGPCERAAPCRYSLSLFAGNKRYTTGRVSFHRIPDADGRPSAVLPLRRRRRTRARWCTAGRGGGGGETSRRPVVAAARRGGRGLLQPSRARRARAVHGIQWQCHWPTQSTRRWGTPPGIEPGPLLVRAAGTMPWRD